MFYTAFTLLLWQLLVKMANKVQSGPWFLLASNEDDMGTAEKDSWQVVPIDVKSLDTQVTITSTEATRASWVAQVVVLTWKWMLIRWFSLDLGPRLSAGTKPAKIPCRLDVISFDTCHFCACFFRNTPHNCQHYLFIKYLVCITMLTLIEIIVFPPKMTWIQELTKIWTLKAKFWIKHINP